MKEKYKASGAKSVLWVFWLLAAKIVFILLLAGLTVWIIYAVHAANSSGAGVRFIHVLGAGYSKDGKTLWLGTDKQLITYKEGSWHSEKLKDSSHADLFLAGGSGFIQMNKTGNLQWKTMEQDPIAHRELNDSLEGFWAFGYKTGRMYRLQEADGESALRYSDDGGNTWDVVKVKNPIGNVRVLEASPVNNNVLAIGTTKGLYVSTDLGAHFHQFLKGNSVSSAAFSFSKQVALFAAVAGKETALYQIIPQQNKSINLDMGTVENDTVTRIVQNPAKFGEAVMITKHGDLYRTENSGQNWTIIAKKGRGLNGN
ncbi:hypothetical protein NIE88_05510 [Sporolactobacillus shoreicorticis]|uniref:Photosynthesis system II assembly factor Ycf48/Hcf136-like domain-containing protein n=1 Tax=Sporolactobacillus shoreicorticis TaxID=1923877 RepID=A0ABW5S0R9_9BACL|nr:hypothetical protein [Sporolactobacillus shoreicorticis]MCO7125230.1 hypothetical protein [Sporolactobacillus shoreicorticis]